MQREQDKDWAVAGKVGSVRSGACVRPVVLQAVSGWSCEPDSDCRVTGVVGWALADADMVRPSQELATEGAGT